VVALGEASMLYSLQLGQRVGVVTINTRYIPWIQHQVAKYGLERRVTGVHAMQFEPGQILKAYESQALADEVRALFDEQAKPLVAAGAKRSFPAAAFRCSCSQRCTSTLSMVRRSSTVFRSR